MPDDDFNLVSFTFILLLFLNLGFVLYIFLDRNEILSEIDFADILDKAKSILLFIVIPVGCKIISFIFKIADILQLPVEIRKTIEQVSKVIGKNSQGKEEEKSALVWDKKKKRFVS